MLFWGFVQPLMGFLGWQWLSGGNANHRGPELGCYPQLELQTPKQVR